MYPLCEVIWLIGYAVLAVIALTANFTYIYTYIFRRFSILYSYLSRVDALKLQYQYPYHLTHDAVVASGQRKAVTPLDPPSSSAAFLTLPPRPEHVHRMERWTDAQRVSTYLRTYAHTYRRTHSLFSFSSFAITIVPKNEPNRNAVDLKLFVRVFFRNPSSHPLPKACSTTSQLRASS
jgi:hypothetical protein